MPHQPVANLLTIRDVTRWAMTEMEKNSISLGHGTEDFWEEATFLVMRTLKLPFDRLQAFWEAHLTPEELEEVLCNIDLRVHMKKPVPYLIKEAWLSEHCFYVDERVLIPRSFIAELLEESLSPWIEDPESVTSVLDMCTGSGCLAILAAETFPNAKVTGADVSPDALDVAVINRKRFGMEDTLELVETDLFENLQGRKYDLIISNPPYVTQAAMAAARASAARKMAIFAPLDMPGFFSAGFSSGFSSGSASGTGADSGSSSGAASGSAGVTFSSSFSLCSRSIMFLAFRMMLQSYHTTQGFSTHFRAGV